MIQEKESQTAPLRVLILEDSPADADLVLRQLRQSGFDVRAELTETEADFRARLDPSLDLILSDYHMPNLDALRALEILHEQGLDVPMLVVSGSAGEEKAVEALQHGAADYLVKGRLDRLGDAVRRALERRRLREQLRRSEELFQIVQRATSDAVWDWNLVTNALWWNENFCSLFGYRTDELEPSADAWYNRLHPDDKDRVITGIHAVIDSGRQSWSDEYRFRRGDGSYAHIFDRGYVVHDEKGRPVRMIGAMADISARKQAEAERQKLFREVETARNRLQILSLRLVDVQEAERHRIAQELHDEIGQELTALKITLQMGLRMSPEQLRNVLIQAQAQVGELLSQVREMSLELRPAMLDDLGLLPALLWHFDRYSTQTGIQIGFKHNGLEGRRFAPEMETAGYRIVQEALTNVARHANVKEVTVQVWVDHETLVVQVEDKGAGFNLENAVASGNSSGLSGMRERASLLGGTLSIRSLPGEGTRLTAELPLGGPIHGRRNHK